MPTVRVMSWRGIPSQVKVTDGTGGSAARMLPDRWQQQIDRVAMRDGLTGTDEYLEGWGWSSPEERQGSVDEVADAVLAELVAEGLPREDR